MKYVTLRRGAFRFPVIFPDAVEHAQFDGADVISAGFFSRDSAGGVSTFGASSTGLGPKKGDAALIQLVLEGKEEKLYEP